MHSGVILEVTHRPVMGSNINTVKYQARMYMQVYIGCGLLAHAGLSCIVQFKLSNQLPGIPPQFTQHEVHKLLSVVGPVFIFKLAGIFAGVLTFPGQVTGLVACVGKITVQHT